ncbi:hexitol phosphatase HxpB [Orbus sasakiae]|uniref:Hexitol phosphatase HxpB n=1 Tax=Orbus sasakiae TaxID=1078475 RepID=A0ABP9N8Y2_9GAMM
MNKSLTLQAVIFDLDGTLIDSEPLLQQAKNTVLNDYGYDTKYFYQHSGVSTTGVRITDLVRRFQTYFPDVIADNDKITHDILNFALEKIKANPPILPGVMEAIECCKSSGLRLGLASSSPIYYIATVIELLGISNDFECKLSADKLDYAKPHPEVYQLAAEKLALLPEQCVAIEDSIVGMIASKSANMHSIVVPSSMQYELPQWGLADIKLPSLCHLTQQHFLTLS